MYPIDSRYCAQYHHIDHVDIAKIASTTTGVNVSIPGHVTLFSCSYCEHSHIRAGVKDLVTGLQT